MTATPPEDGSTTRILAGLLERTHGRSRVGFWSVIGATVALLAAVVVAVLLLLRGGGGGGGDGDPKRGGDVTVNVQVPGVTNVNNVTVTFILDGRPVSPEELSKPMRLVAGEDELKLRTREGKEEVRRFEVRDGDEGRQVFVLPNEPKGPPGELRVFRKHSQPVASVAVSPDGSRVLSVAKGEVLLWDVDNENLLVSKPIPRVLRGAFFPDGRVLVGGGPAGRGQPLAVAWDHELKVDRRNFGVGVQDSYSGPLALSADGLRIACCHRFGQGDGHDYVTYHHWASETGKHVFPPVVKRDTPAGPLCFAGNRILMVTGNNLSLTEPDSWKEAGRLKGHSETVTAVAATADGRTAASGSGDAANSIRLWDLDGGAEKHVLGGHQGRVTSLAFSPDGRRLLSGSVDKTVRLWDVASGKELHCFRGHQGGVNAVAYSPGGRRALSGSADKTVRVWQLPE